MSPRTFDDIPVSTVFAEEKSRESENSDTRKSTTSLRSQNSRKISRESRDSKKSKKSEKSENEPDQESVETAKKLKKELEDTIRNHFRNTIKVHTSFRFDTRWTSKWSKKAVTEIDRVSPLNWTILRFATFT